MKLNKSSALFSILMLSLGLNVTACSKHESEDAKPTEEIAAEQGELARKANPEPTASQPAAFKPDAPAASSNSATATASTAAASSTKTASATTTTTTASAPATTAATASKAGEELYAQTCKTCHESGLAGAPKFGDKAAWKDRIAQGKDTLHKHALEGFTGKSGTMPPKGGNTAASDSDVKAAVDYMVSKAS